MRSIRALVAICGVAGIFATGAAMGQIYQPSPALLRYPLPQLPPAVAQTPTPMQPGAQAMAAYPQYAAPYYATNSPPQMQLPNGLMPSTAYAAQGSWAQPPAGFPGAQQYWYAPNGGRSAQQVVYPGYYPPGYYPAAPSPRTAVNAATRSVLFQGQAPAEVIAAPPVQTQPSPSDVPAYGAPQDNAYYYPDTKTQAPAYPAANPVVRNALTPAGNCDPNYGPYGSWSPYAAYENGYGGFAGSSLDGAPFGYGSPYGGGNPAACGPPASCGPPPVCGPPLWFAGVYGLYMSRDHENQYMFSYDDAWESIQLTDSRDSNPGCMGGVEVRFGRYFNCGLNAVQAVYWGVVPEEGNSPFPDAGFTLTPAWAATGNLDGILNWDDLNYNGSTAEWWVNGAVAHAVFRENEFHNVEINLLQFGSAGLSSAWGSGGACGTCNPCDPCACADPCGARFRYGWLAGIRWFHFRDALVFGADTVNSVFNYAPEEIYYQIQTVNNLIGFQVGGRGEYGLTQCLSLDFGHKVGLYGNHSEHASWIGGAAGVARINNGPNIGQPFDVSASKNDTSLLGEVRVGLSYRFTPYWVVSAGYRMIGATGVALPTNQIYPDLRGINDLENVDSNGSVILHGGYLGVEYGF